MSFLCYNVSINGGKMEDNPLQKLANKYSYETVDCKVNQFVDNLKRYDVANVLVKLVEKSFVFANNSESKKAEDYRMMIGYIQSLYAGNIFTNTLHCKEKEFNDLIEDCNSIINSCVIAESINTPIDESLADFSSRLYEISQGKTYPIFAPWILENLLKPQDSLLKESYGITADEVITGLLNIAKALTEAAAYVINGNSLSKDMLMVKKITNWPDNFINDLSFENGIAEEFSTRDKFANWFNIEMPTKQKPFIKIDGISYLFEFSIVFDNFYRSIQKAICKQNKHFIDVWQENQKEASENFATGLFSYPLLGSFCSLNNYYRLDKNNWIENDAIIVYKNILFVMEVKAGSFTPRSVILDNESHKTAKKSLIEKPIFQSERLITKLDRDKSVEIFDASHKNKICTLNREEFKFIIPIVVTLDPIGEILSMYRNKEELNFLPISLEDLAIYSNFFENEPIFFIHYLLERVKNINVKNFMINDELDFLGGYLANRNFNHRYNHLVEEEGLEESNIGSLWVDNMHEQLDLYFGCAMSTKKPQFNVSDFIYDLIKSFEKNLNANLLNLAIIILGQNDMFHDNLEDCVSKIINRQAVTNKFASITIFFEDNSEFIPIQLFANDDNNICTTEEKAKKYALATMKARVYANIYYLIINTNHGKISSIIAKYLNEENFIDVETSELEFLQSYIQTNSLPLNKSDKTKDKKIGRNDLCPCGSGRKYKKCCLNK